MFLVTTGPRGTLRSYFKDFPVNVAAKSGTAQQSSKRSEHTTFVAFAPLEDHKFQYVLLFLLEMEQRIMHLKLQKPPYLNI
ncbi:MAG: penicillin-binding transpeptidase domain-containing protein [Lachnospirales bacterium]